MNFTKTFFIVLCAVFFYGKSMAQDVQRKVCQGTDLTKWTDCNWKGSFSNGDKYEGEFKDGAFNGLGLYYFFQMETSMSENLKVASGMVKAFTSG